MKKLVSDVNLLHLDGGTGFTVYMIVKIHQIVYSKCLQFGFCEIN